MLHDPNQTTLFPKLPDEALQQMRSHGTEIQLAAGEILFTEGEENYGFHVVLEGEIEITKVVSNEKRLLAIHHQGEFMGEISMLNHSASIASAQATVASSVLRIEVAAFKRLLIECASVGDTILAAMVGRTIDVEGQLRQQEKLAALGKMSAGLAHELNNPAAAGKRAANALKERFTSLQSLTVQLNQHCLTTEQLKFLAKVQIDAISYGVNSPQYDTLTQGDQEDEVTDWLENHDVSKAWQLAPTLVNFGIDSQKLAEIKSNLDSQSLNDALVWLEANLATSGLINEVEQSTTRISELVKAVKGYTYMDTAPLQEIDIHEGIDNTLLILGHKCERGELWPGRLEPETDLFDVHLPKTKATLQSRISEQNLQFFAISTFGVLRRNDPRPNRVSERATDDWHSVLRNASFWKPYNMIAPLYWLSSGKRMKSDA